MNQKTKKIIYRKLDIIWRIIGAIILILFVFILIIGIGFGIINNTLTLITFSSIVLYAIISVIIFLPPILIKLFKKLRKKAKKK